MSSKDWKNEKNYDQWIDFLEGELEPSLEDDLSILLEGDAELQTLVREFEEVKLQSKKYLKREDKNLDEAIFSRIHDNVMSEIKQVIPLSAKSKISRNYLAYAASVCLILVAAAMGIYKGDKAKQVGGEQFAQLELKELLSNAKEKDISSFSDTIMNHEDDMDLLLGSGSEKLNRLSQDELNAMFERL